MTPDKIESHNPSIASYHVQPLRSQSSIGNHSFNSYSSFSSNATLNPPLAARPSIVQASNVEHREFLLSIGRIFHRICLVDSEITVTRYRPRHPYPPINVDYRYRFQAPQHSTYEISGVNFTTEKLENFNWNFMDQYICTRGDTDYRLQEVNQQHIFNLIGIRLLLSLVFFFIRSITRTWNIGDIACIYCPKSIWQQRKFLKVPSKYHATFIRIFPANAPNSKLMNSCASSSAIWINWRRIQHSVVQQE